MDFLFSILNKMPNNFDLKSYSWKAGINYRLRPEFYRVGKGEQGVLLCEPYKSEILPYWRFKNPQVASESSKKILQLFYTYLKNGDFIGADMARKFLQMGFTRSRRYANYKGGRKYNPKDGSLNPRNTGDPQKGESATIFYQAWQEAEKNMTYALLKEKWKKQYG